VRIASTKNGDRSTWRVDDYYLEEWNVKAAIGGQVKPLGSPIKLLCVLQ
jgi:hypothetical protein